MQILHILSCLLLMIDLALTSYVISPPKGRPQLLLLAPVLTYEDPMVVQTSSGKVRGARMDMMGRPLDVFLGIPFAKPPVGDLRFKKPVPVDRWVGEVQATKLPNSCLQEPLSIHPGFEGETRWHPNTPTSEDCLYLSLYVPSTLRNGGNATVMVWIHGGAYITGTSTLFDASVLSTANDVIVATINYRLGVFGYLYMGDEEAPGNMGMYDQVMAIQWIKDNIRSFGGNPDSLTLFGESAGAGSVSFHLLSPISRHLASRAILQSGTINAPWSFQTADKAREVSLKMAAALGCLTSPPEVADTREVMQCMRNVEPRALTFMQFAFFKGILNMPWTPVIDGVFLPGHPEEMLLAGDFAKTDILIGNNQDEGSLFLLYEFKQDMNKDLPTAIDKEHFHAIVDAIFKDLSELEREAARFQYTDWERSNDVHANQKILADILGDTSMVCPSNRFAQMFAAHGANVYYYHFNHRTSISPWGKWMGVMHGDELDYVFGRPLVPLFNYTDSERQLSLRMMNHFTTFAKTGKPMGVDCDAWPTYSKDEPKYFVLNGDQPAGAIGHGPRATTCAFWSEMIPLIRAQQIKLQTILRRIGERVAALH